MGLWMEQLMVRSDSCDEARAWLVNTTKKAASFQQAQRGPWVVLQVAPSPPAHDGDFAASLTSMLQQFMPGIQVLAPDEVPSNIPTPVAPTVPTFGTLNEIAAPLSEVAETTVLHILVSDSDDATITRFSKDVESGSAAWGLQGSDPRFDFLEDLMTQVGSDIERNEARHSPFAEDILWLVGRQLGVNDWPIDPEDFDGPRASNPTALRSEV